MRQYVDDRALEKLEVGMKGGAGEQGAEPTERNGVGREHSGVLGIALMRLTQHHPYCACIVAGGGPFG